MSGNDLKIRLGYLLWVIRYESWIYDYVWGVEPMISIEIFN